MKKWVLGVCVLLMDHTGFSQNWDEWFRQKKTKIKYLEQQIVALQAYIEVAQKGYAIYQDGLQFIGEVKQGDINLHTDYFSSLSTVKTSIGQSDPIKEIFKWQQDIELMQQHWVHTNNAEIDHYVKQVFSSLLEKTRHCARETQLLTSDGRYQLTDQERMKRIAAAHDQMQDDYVFAKWMQQQVAVVARGHQQDRRDAHVLEKLSDIQ